MATATTVHRSSLSSESTASETTTTTTTTKSTTQRHYERHTAASYEDGYFASPGAYMDFVRDHIQNRLGLSSNDTTTTTKKLLDVGGGTGHFTKLLVRDTPNVQAVVVDPFLEFSSSDDDREQVQFIKARAEEFSKNRQLVPWRRDYHQVLMKEMIHHLKASDRVDIFRSIRGDLMDNDVKADNKNKCSLLIVTRPKVETDYPFWPEAQEVWEQNQPSWKELRKDLMQAGYTSVKVEMEAYPCELHISRWLHMIRNRFWSTFSHFSDDALEEACRRFLLFGDSHMDDQGMLHFEDRLLFLSATI